VLLDDKALAIPDKRMLALILSDGFLRQHERGLAQHTDAFRRQCHIVAAEQAAHLKLAICISPASMKLGPVGRKLQHCATRLTRILAWMNRGCDGETLVARLDCVGLVEYPSVGADPVRRLYAHGFIYVLEASVVMQVCGEEEVIANAGSGIGPWGKEGTAHVIGLTARWQRRRQSASINACRDCRGRCLRWLKGPLAAAESAARRLHAGGGNVLVTTDRS
jgi:hypothetical protein